MTSYQSFPGTAGASNSFAKLQALRLPSLTGKSFLDVGCNEGFFCGYAAFDGAERIVGIDAVAESVLKARSRFPKIEFINDNWDNLPDELFDLILCASALHYASDQAALVANLIAKLKSGGILVLEIGVHPGTENEWISVERGIDNRHFATWSKIEEVLRPYAWKHMGPSVKQSGDPISRQVFHVSVKAPIAYLLTAPPASGKSTIARDLFSYGTMRIVSGDRLIDDIAEGRVEAPALQIVVAQDYSRQRIDAAIQRMIASGMLETYAELVLREANGRDFVYDGYLPDVVKASFVNHIETRGYMVVSMLWRPVGTKPPQMDRTRKFATAYLASLKALDDPQDENAAPSFKSGIVDSLTYTFDTITLRGWCVTEDDKACNGFKVTLNGVTVETLEMSRELRPDVARHLGSKFENVGFRITFVRTDRSDAPRVEDLRVTVACGSHEWSELRLGGNVTAQLSSSADL